ncbi:MAG: DUF512 domain-containing protein, partial [Candidatus Zixiibacteriota bacterium]
YRDKLPHLRVFTPTEAAGIVDYLEQRQRQFLLRLGSRFVWPADEFYIRAQREFPKRRVYEDLPQFENGVGMVREFLTVFNRRRRILKNIRSKKRVLFLTGFSAAGIFESVVFPFLKNELGLNIDIKKVPNIFWGKTVTVSGLLTGRDILKEAEKVKNKYDMVVLPPNCLNSDGLFLDDISLAEFRAGLDRPVLVGRYDLTETIKEIYS